MAGHQGMGTIVHERVEWGPELETLRCDSGSIPSVNRGIRGIPPMCYVYILCCVDGSFYVGWTRNLDDRVRTHNEGRGSTYTSRRRPVRLVYSETFRYEADAIHRESQLKRWSAAKKESLIMGDVQKLKRLSKPRM